MESSIFLEPLWIIRQSVFSAEIENEIGDGENGPEPLAALKNAALATLRVEAEKNRSKEVRQLRLNALKFYNQLWEYMSVESRQEISQHPVLDNQRNTLPLADTDKIASILNTLNCAYTLQMLHSMQRPTVNYNLAITKLVRIT